jgi:hypothetical protein
VIVGPDLTHNGGHWDAFVAKVNAAGTALVYAGYIGGAGQESGFGMAVDAAGNAYITGNTYSDQTSFPVTIGPDLTHNAASDAYVAKINAEGTALESAGYVGGAGNESAYRIAVDSTGQAYITGATTSDENGFPITGGLDSTYNSNGDAFVAKVNTAGTDLVYASYLGGGNEEIGLGISVDAAGNTYVVGSTVFDQNSFPVFGGPDLSYNGGLLDSFVVKNQRRALLLDRWPCDRHLRRADGWRDSTGWFRPLRNHHS